ncbi:MAG: hypothetical protein SCH98_06015 [Deferrisomatales bacterium]|nr:hypothetical protein [Deferrisomatales bacterium]
MSDVWEERLVTYTLEVEGEIIIVEHVPARVNEETGERCFAPDTADKQQGIIRERWERNRVTEAPDFDFAASVQQFPAPYWRPQG